MEWTISISKKLLNKDIYEQEGKEKSNNEVERENSYET